MTTLADINDTLIKNRQVLGAKQTYTSARVDALSAGFKKFTDLLEAESNADDLESNADDLDALGESRKGGGPKAIDVKKSGEDGSGKGRFFDFDVGNLIPLVGGVLAGLLKRGGLAIIAGILADEIGQGIAKLTGSDALGNVAEWATMGGAFGFLFGAKFGLLGAVIGAIFSEASREKIAGILSDVFEEEIGKADKATFLAAGAASAVAAFMPKLLFKLVPKLVGFLLSPVGLVVIATAAVLGLAIGYFTNDEFKSSVDKMIQPLRDKMTKFRDDMIESTKNFLNNLFDPFITTAEENEKIDKKMSPEDLAAQKKIQDQIAATETSRGEIFSARQAQFGDYASGNQSLERVRKAGEEAGIDLENTKNEDGVKLSSIEDTNTLFFAINKILMDRQAALEKQLAPILEKRDEIEVDIEKKEDISNMSDSSLSSRIKTLTAMKSSPNFSRSDNAQRTAAINEEIKILQTEQQSRILSPAVVDASTTNNGSSTTVITPPTPSANNGEDPVREVVVF